MFTHQTVNIVSQIVTNKSHRLTINLSMPGSVCKYMHIVCALVLSSKDLKSKE